jgi:hypothetical protein
MILADSLLPDPRRDEFVDLSALARSRRRFDALEHATVLYPRDPEVWAELGEARLRVSRTGSDAEATLFAFERAIAADSLFGPAYPLAIHLTLMLRGRDSALSLARRHLRINHEDRVISPMVEILSGNRSDAELRQVVGKLSPEAARDAAFALARWPDADETGVRLFRLIVSQESNPPQVFFGAALRFRGRIREAASVPDLGYRHSVGGASDLLFYSRYSPPDARALDSLTVAWTSAGRPDAFPIVIARAAEKNDSVGLRHVARLAAQFVKTSTRSLDSLQWQYVGSLANAYLALASADSTAALAAFRELPDSLAWTQTTISAVITESRLLSQRGRGTEAVALLARHPLSPLGVNVWQPAWHLAMARAAAAARDFPRARAAFAFAAAAWSGADLSLVQEVADCAADLRRHGAM